MYERARAEEQRRGRAATILQAGARGYLTRKKWVPSLLALKEKRRIEIEIEREEERVRTQGAVTIQAIWKGYRYSYELDRWHAPHEC